MKQCVFILPYFGKFNNYFNFFLRSCKHNTDYDWVVLTDDKTPYDFPANVRPVYMSFDECRKRFQDKFDFDISLNKPYKLCDFRPAYGYVFPELIEEYPYWGFCDCDLIFGNLNKLLTPILQKNYDKVFAVGHLTMYRNYPENNTRFMNELPGYGRVYKKALTTDESVVFDESYYRVNSHRIFEADHCRLWTKDLAYNTSVLWEPISRIRYNDNEHRWRETNKVLHALYWTKGNIFDYRLSSTNKPEEYLYAHFQWRKMDMQQEVLASPAVLISSHEFAPVNHIDKHRILSDILNQFKTAICVSQLRRFKRLLINERNLKLPFGKNPYWKHNPYATDQIK